jgi:hypothetical protein
LRQAIRALARRILFRGQLQIQASEKSKHLLATEPLPAWVALKGEPIEVQEFLQSVVREFQWRVGENHASEDTWSFVRYLNDCEGYVRVQISTHFQGYGNRPASFPARRQPCGRSIQKASWSRNRLARRKLALTPLEAFSVGGDGTR